jgi:hypothetical protein
LSNELPLTVCEYSIDFYRSGFRWFRVLGSEVLGAEVLGSEVLGSEVLGSRFRVRRFKVLGSGSIFQI